MGVDWYPCSDCGETFPDCGSYVSCGSCGSMFHDQCADDLREEFGTVSEDMGSGWNDYGEDALRSCAECSNTIVHDDVLLEHIANKYEIDLEEVRQEILQERGVTNGK